MPRVAASECSDSRSAQSREGLPPEFGKDADVCRWRPTRADPLLSRSPYWWRRPRQTHFLPTGIATASPSGRLGAAGREEARDAGKAARLKTPKGREGVEIFAPPPYRRGHDRNSFRPR